MDGVPEEVIVHRLEETEQSPQLTQKIDSPAVGDIRVAMPGTIVNVEVKKHDKVKRGQVVLILEAMKMETEIQANLNGEVTEIFCKKGDKVTPEQVLLKITPLHKG